MFINVRFELIWWKTDVDEDFSFQQPLILITKDVNEQSKIMKDEKKKAQRV